MTFLFDEIVFGPVKSRRFGVSLGMNLLPVNYKYCTFNCLYCECGWSHEKSSQKIELPTRKDIKSALEERLIKMEDSEKNPDNITFAGNGEPTVHPEFEGIIDDTIDLRDRYFPGAEITVLSNASLLHKEKVFKALNKVDNNVLKIDSVIEPTFRLINQPNTSLSVSEIIRNIKKFNGNQIIQTLFLRGEFNGEKVDNTTKKEIDAWIKILREIRPKYVMIYPVERDTALPGIEKIPFTELEDISNQVKSSGIKTKIYY